MEQQTVVPAVRDRYGFGWSGAWILDPPGFGAAGADGVV